jgi:hypothetical protein
MFPREFVKLARNFKTCNVKSGKLKIVQKNEFKMADTS